MTNQSAGSAIAALAEAAVRASSVEKLVEHPQAAWVLARLKAVAPVAFGDLRKLLAADSSWGKRGVRALDGAIVAGAERYQAVLNARSATEDARPKVHYLPATMDRAASEVAVHLAASGSRLEDRPVFVYGDQLVMAVVEEPETVRQRLARRDETYPAMARLKLLEVHSLRRRVMRDVNVRISAGKKGWISASPPDELLQMLLKAPEGFHKLTGLLEAPTLTPEGSLLLEPGYHRPTGLLLAFDPHRFPLVPERPTKAEARAAYDWLVREFLDGFEFASERDEAAAVAMLITALIRKMVDLVPIFAATAALQSSGKSTLCDLVSRAAYGRPVAASSCPTNEEEMQKRIVGWLLEGQASVLLDNVADGQRVDSAELAKLVTCEVYQGRILGRNQEARLPAGLLLMVTGNAIGFSRDLAGRVVTCALAPRTDRPEQRAFGREDPAGWVDARRGEIVAKALTIVKAYLAAVETVPGEAVRVRTRFPRWDRMVRQPLLWLFDGGEERDLATAFQDNLALAREGDSLDEATAALFAVFGATAFTAADVWRAYENEHDPTLAGKPPGTETDGETFAAALDALAAKTGNRGALTRRRTGYVLSAVENRPAAGHILQVTRQLSGDRTKEYAFVPLAGGGPPAGQQGDGGRPDERSSEIDGVPRSGESPTGTAPAAAEAGKQAEGEGG